MEQISEKDSLDTVYFIKDSLRSIKSISISYHSPFTSSLEGLMSRGDERVGEVLLEAWRRGARLDAWDEYLDKDAWKGALEAFTAKWGVDILKFFLTEKSADYILPWKGIHIFVGDSYFEAEAVSSTIENLTSGCAEECEHPCGSCNEDFSLVSNFATNEVSILPSKPAYWGFGIGVASETPLSDRRLLISYEKAGAAAYFPMHSFSNLFARAFTILGLPVRFTEGFNPLPRMEFSQPLSLGIVSEEELLALWLDHDLTLDDEKKLLAGFANTLPRDLKVRQVRLGLRRSDGRKSIGSIYGASEYRIAFKNVADCVKVREFLENRGIEILKQSVCQIQLLLPETKPGIGSISRILKDSLESERFLESCSVTRMRLYGKRVESDYKPLIDML